MEGLAMAKCQEVYKGGRARLDRTRVKQLADMCRAAAIARELGMAKSPVYRLLEEVRRSPRPRTGGLRHRRS
jgi:hypothetical protein